MSKPQNLITFQEFNDMRSEFDSSIRTKLGSQETNSVWWTFENLKEYFDYIEAAANNNRIEISGIRFNMVANTTGNKELTLALVPTYLDTNSNHIEFDPTLSTSNSPTTLTDIDNDLNKSNQSGAILNRGVHW
jgi:hypothetical protein